MVRVHEPEITDVAHSVERRIAQYSGQEYLARCDTLQTCVVAAQYGEGVTQVNILHREADNVAGIGRNGSVCIQILVLVTCAEIRY